MKWLPWFQGRRIAQTVLNNLEDVRIIQPTLHTEKDTSAYFLPNDDWEMNRLDFQHLIMNYAMQRNYVAPIENPQSVLDIGSGTGRWARELAIQFPHANVYGVDIDSSLAKASDTNPSNYSFLTADILQQLPFPDETFDFVHQRFLHTAVPTNAWEQVIQELLRITRKGGWIELTESDLRIQQSGPATQMLNNWGYTIFRARKIDPLICVRLGSFLYQANLKDIQTYRVDLPIGNWAGHLGTAVASDLLAFNLSIRPIILEQLKIPLTQYTRMSQAMHEEWESNHSYFSVYIACGQKQ